MRSPASDYGAVAMGNIGDTRVRFRTKATVRFIDFVRPDGYWPAPYTIEQAFEIFRWMVYTGEEIKTERGDAGKWGTCTVLNLLQCQPTCVNAHGGVNIFNIDRLRSGFQHAVLSGYESHVQRRWRQQNDITPIGERIIHFRHHAPFTGAASEADIKRTLNTYFAMPSRNVNLVKRLNSFYADAVELQSTNVRVQAKGFKFWISYGVNGSGWDHELAKTEGNETFLQTFRRADKALQVLTGEDTWPDGDDLIKQVDRKPGTNGPFVVEQNGIDYRIEWTGRRQSQCRWEVTAATAADHPTP